MSNIEKIEHILEDMCVKYLKTLEFPTNWMDNDEILKSFDKRYLEELCFLMAYNKNTIELSEIIADSFNLFLRVYISSRAQCNCDFDIVIDSLRNLDKSIVAYFSDDIMTMYIKIFRTTQQELQHTTEEEY